MSEGGGSAESAAAPTKLPQSPAGPWWLALLPVCGPLAFLALGKLRRFRELPRPWVILLGVFMASQLLAAVMTPSPILSLVLALVRSLYVVALVILGFTLGDSARLRPALIGFTLVAVTAFVTSLLLSPAHPFSSRLVHPYYTSVSLGLAGALGLLIAITWRGGPTWWRLVGGAACLSMFLWSGSRGPLIALGLGLLAALVVSAGRQWRGVLAGVTGAALLVGLLQLAVPGGVVGRFMQNTLNGRGAYWADALDTARLHPWGGVGPYQLGPHLTTQFSQGSCQLWLPTKTYGLSVCPPLLDQLRGGWLIAHNTAFHLLGENGVIGLSGWLALMGALALAAWRSRDSLANAMTWAAVGMGLVDNPTTVPNVGHAELYWLVGGVAVAMSLRSQHVVLGAGPGSPAFSRPLAPAAPLLACGLLLYFTLPLWLERLHGPNADMLPQLQGLALPKRLDRDESVVFFLKTSVPVEGYQLRGVVCRVGITACRTLFQTPLVSKMSGRWQAIELDGLPTGEYSFRLQVRNKATQLRVDRPLSESIRVIQVE